jgi:hypothetical protein
LIQPILYKTAFYWVVVFFARLLRRLCIFVRGEFTGRFHPYLRTIFSWHRFSAISCGSSSIPDLCDGLGNQPSFRPRRAAAAILHVRPSDLQLNRRQRIRELLRLVADAHSVEEFRNPTSLAHRQMVEILQRLARQSPIR